MLKWFGAGILGLIILFILIAFLLPAGRSVSRSAIINCKPGKVFGYLIKADQWKYWMVRKDWDTSTFKTEVMADGEGAAISIGENHSTLSIKSIRQDSVIIIELEASRKEEFQFSNEALDDGTRVTLQYDVDTGKNPWNRWIDYFVGANDGEMLEGWLNLLKVQVENLEDEPELIAGFKFEIREMPQILVAGVRAKVNLNDPEGPQFSRWYAEIGNLLANAGLQMAGSPMAIYFGNDSISTDIESAVPVSSPGTDNGNVKFHSFPQTRAIVVKYLGDYANTGLVYGEMTSFMQKKGFERSGAPMEIFVTDPGIQPDTSKWLTEIIFPIK